MSQMLLSLISVFLTSLLLTTNFSVHVFSLLFVFLPSHMYLVMTNKYLKDNEFLKMALVSDFILIIMLQISLYLNLKARAKLFLES